ncbi:MAG: hypothetical protein HKN43_14205 [Rhodothermales bacterium]|nr:hypothetical protein [Rhodothermales bacterium]
MDDYNSHYWISEASWIQDSSYAFHVVTWNTDQKYIIARNDSLNPSEAGLYSRIDYVELSMEPYTWAFCLTTYDATTAAAAAAHHSADQGNPRTGCSGFPFTRMRPL